MDKNSDHWQFALACAVEWLRRFVYEFDFKASLSGHAVYVGITPDILISYIDGFLSEKEFVLGGTANDILQLRKAVVESVVPAYLTGKKLVHSIWAATANDEERDKLMYTPPEEIMIDAWSRVPVEVSPSQANWFVEAFCATWGQEWFVYQAGQLSDAL